MALYNPNSRKDLPYSIMLQEPARSGGCICGSFGQVCPDMSEVTSLCEFIKFIASLHDVRCFIFPVFR